MSALSQLLDRLRRLGPPPGRAAGVVAVPSAGDELSAEVSFLFGELDQIDKQAALIVSAARAEAAEIEASARRQRERLLELAHEDGERDADALLAQRRERCEREAQALLTGAEREAGEVLARGRERTPGIVKQATTRLLKGPS